MSGRLEEGVWAVLGKAKRSRVRRLEGSIVKIPLGNGKSAYGLVLKEPLIAVFDREFADAEEPEPESLVSLPIAFEVMVMNYAVTEGHWPVVGRVTVPDHLEGTRRFCKQDLITGELSIYHEIEELAPYYEQKATPEECRGLETAAVWEPEHVEDRIRDHFAGRPNVWVEQLRIVP